MRRLVKYDSENDILTIECTCGNILEEDLSSIEEIKIHEHFNEYENLMFQCSNCNLIIGLNTNIPVSEYEEIEYEETVMRFNEINDRKIMRDLLWNKRADLKNMDRTAYNQEKIEYLERWNKTKEENPTRADIARIEF